ncbi:hypothetical protein JRI60_36365 [Archangium violaceum]|uniref:hypothetical protein n=1 Tax=Archangium violaceum TaxID=83451 RepID=UPI0019506FA9|nr:hypothetical protein [Archangium violaceum]QRN94563.1 hypothetical protein JRI60_36365 [Archangium violaceum]
MKAKVPASMAVRSPVFLVTNRYNLLDVLSSGLIVPYEGIEKYYPDLLERTPGRLLLVGAPFNEGVLALASDETDPTSFPVAIELDSNRLSAGKVPSLGEDGQSIEQSIGAPSAIAWAPLGAIPLSAIKCVHFASDKDREEHEARRYENVRVDALPTRTSPELFSEATARITPEAFLAWLSSLPTSQGVDARTFDTLDRHAGAWAVLASALPASANTLGAFATLLTEATSSRPTKKGAKRKPKAAAKRSGVFPGWLELTPAGTRLDDTPPAQADLDTRLFLAALGVFRASSPRERWRPLDVLSSIEASVREMSLSAQDEAELLRNLEPIRSILRNERDFRPLNTGKGLLVAKALLLVMLRPEPQRLLAWDRQASGASDAMMMTAAVLSGLLSGHKRLPISLRSEGLDTFLAEHTAGLLSPAEGVWTTPSRPDQNLSVEEITSENGPTSLVIMWRGLPLLSRTKPPPTLAETMLSMSLSDPAKNELALRIVRALDWSDCVRSVISLPAGEYSLKRGKGSSLMLTTTGFPTVTHALDEARFNERITKEGVPPDREKQLWEIVTGEAPAPHSPAMP